MAVLEQLLKNKQKDRQQMEDITTSLSSPDEMDAMEIASSLPPPKSLEEMQAEEPSIFDQLGEKVGDFATGFQRGVKEELLPFAVGEEEIAEQKAEGFDLSKLAGEVTGGIVSGIVGGGVAAKLGTTTAIALGTMVGAPAALVGTIAAVGAGAGLAAYSIYSGFGQEKVASEIAEQDFSTARALARTALQINPVARLNGEAAKILAKPLVKLGEAAASTTGRAVRGVGQVAGEMAVTGSTYGTEAALVNGAIGSLLYGLAFRKAAAPSARRAQDLQEYLASPVGEQYAKDVQKEFATLVAKDKGVKVSATAALQDSGFVNYLLARPGKGTPLSAIKEDLSELVTEIGGRRKKALTEEQKAARVQKLLSVGEEKGGLTPKNIEEMYEGYRLFKVQMDVAKKTKDKVAKDFLGKGVEPEPFGDIASWLADGQLIGRATDRMFGTQTTSLLNDLAETRGKFDVVAAASYEKAIQASKLQKKLKLSNEDVGRLRVFLSEGDDSLLTPVLRKLVDVKAKRVVDEPTRQMITAWDKAWSSARKNIIDENYAIGDIKHYLPMKPLQGSTLATQIRRSYESLVGLKVEADAPDIFKLTRKELKKTGLPKAQTNAVVNEVSFLRNFTARSLNKSYSDVTEADLGRLIKGVLESGGGDDVSLGYEISAMFARGKDAIPAKFRELDNSAAFSRYIESNVRGAVYSEVHSRLQNNVTILRSAGANKAADWFEDHLDDTVNGLKSSKTKLAHTMQDSARKFEYNMDKLFENTRFEDTFVQDAVKGIPSLLGKWQANLYPAYLAYNVRSTLRNLTQVAMLTAPELGGGYGYGSMARAYLNLYKDFKDESGKFSLKTITRKLEELDLGGSKILAEAIADGRNKIPGSGVVRKINDTGMAIFSAADVINRMVTYRMGQQLAQDAIQNNPEAITALAKLGKATLANLQTPKILAETRRGKSDALGDALGKMLVAKTQFHYGAEQRAKYARFMGPMFSMFTKWPTSIGSNIVDVWQENPNTYERMKRYTELYAAPLLALSAIGQAIEENEGDYGALTYLIGEPTDVAAIAAVSDFTLFQNPAMQAFGTMTKGAMQFFADPTEDKASMLARTTLKKTIKTSIPPVSSVINELERIEKDLLGEQKTSLDEFAEDIFGG